MEFATLARASEQLEHTSTQRTMISMLADLLRPSSDLADIQYICYLLQGRIVPFFVALEIGMAEKTVTRAIAYHTRERAHPVRYAW